VDTIILLTVAGLAIWFWLDSARARELATHRVRTECRRRGLLLLDETVALRRLRLRPTPRGLRFRREFDFDFNDGTEQRFRGQVVLVGTAVDGFDLGGWLDPRLAEAGVEVGMPAIPQPRRDDGAPEHGGNVVPLRRR
jgi:hypothetical protein